MVQAGKGRWVKIGKQIRTLRQRAGLSQEELAKQALVSPTMLSAMERGARGIKREHAERIDDVLSTGGAVTHTWDRSSGSGLPSWYQRVIDVERAASMIQEYHPLLIPGLLQTEEYARCSLRAGLPNESAAEIDDLVQARLDRQVIVRSDRPPRLLVVLDESVLRRPTGGEGVMKRQLEYILEISDEAHISLQVVPFATEYHPGLSNSFILFGVPDRGTILYIETRRSGVPTDEAEAVDDYARLFGDLRGAALPLPASRHLIEQIQGEFS